MDSSRQVPVTSWSSTHLGWEWVRDEDSAIAVIVYQRRKVAPRFDGIATLRRFFRGARGHG